MAARYEVQIQERAAKAIERLPLQIKELVTAAIVSLGGKPRPRGVKKLRLERTWRIRVGDYRVIYQIHDDRLIVLVVRVGHRRDVYR